MAIHHATVKKAEKLGVMLTEVEDGAIRAFWPKRNVEFIGSSATDAMTQMQAIMAIMGGDEYRVEPVGNRQVNIYRYDDGHVMAGCPMVPEMAHKMLIVAKTARFVDPTPYEKEKTEAEEARLSEMNKEQSDDGTMDGERSDNVAAANSDDSVSADTGDKQVVARSEKGVALDGRIAYAEGTPAGDNPFPTDGTDEEYELAQKWDADWDAAADEAAEAEEKKGGSVVSERYRALYAEMGHPTHCGDWLAVTLNNLVIVGKHTDLEYFERICEANGVDMSKYNKTSPGWQGRFRMTGRNLLAKKVYLAGGELKVPKGEGIEIMKAPAEWLQAQKYKMPKADQAKEIPQPESER